MDPFKIVDGNKNIACVDELIKQNPLVNDLPYTMGQATVVFSTRSDFVIVFSDNFFLRGEICPIYKLLNKDQLEKKEHPKLKTKW
jgi:hypothetical protein